MTIEFFQTVMGKEFYDSTMPRIAKALEKIAKRLEKDAEERQAVVPPISPKKKTDLSTYKRRLAHPGCSEE
jgi:hypothetical protein